MTAVRRLLAQATTCGRHRATPATRPEHRAARLIARRQAFTTADRRRASAVAS